ncbi:SDR family NAD(P)-dependent oxidoreductase [Fodinibius sediminis]|uniref:NADP-dependent 3-hydroxy acid dehydrogenase YdfG n=1 Tax=Fodinibius sediminis TaxID=1214077 RepID=A0A521DA93_9BACT|nr:SDR family NAD(P)-dependent oxidoreductase [Fodinibius sediminis]SMO68522.1 NADP-dependent 3-hydroxy acid dehydrogenase YdfG [Fodinibius sediminis]
MENRLLNKYAVITGATSGIGAATARAFGNAGCNLMLTGRRRERLEEIAETICSESEHDIETQTAAFDVRDVDACKKMVDNLTQPVDILVNNAGLAKGVDAVFNADLADWDLMIDTNIKGLVTMTRLIAPGMKKRNEGHIINVGSIASHESYPGGSIYTATKHAVKAFTESTKKDLHGTKVRVSMVSPGLVETEFSVVRYDGDKSKADQVYEDMRPLVGQDIAEVIHFTANRPAHVNIMDTIIFPVDQSSATMVYQDNE